jgi:hypothetical protein
LETTDTQLNFLAPGENLGSHAPRNIDWKDPTQSRKHTTSVPSWHRRVSIPDIHIDLRLPSSQHPEVMVAFLHMWRFLGEKEKVMEK